MFLRDVVGLSVLAIGSCIDVENSYRHANNQIDSAVRNPSFAQQNQAYQSQSSDIFFQPQVVELTENGISAQLFSTYYSAKEDYVNLIGKDDMSMMGASVASSPSYAIISSYGHRLYEGLVEVYLSDSHCEWNYHSELKSPLAGSINFGVSVDIDEKNVVIGASSYDFYSGTAFIYSLTSTNTSFRLVDTIHPPRVLFGLKKDGFGSKVAVNGKHVLVGTFSNSAYMFEHNQQSRRYDLAYSFPLTDAMTSIALESNTAVIGSENTGTNQAGSVSIFTLNTTGDGREWPLSATLSSPGGAYSHFGFSVSLSGTTLVVGAPGIMSDAFQGQTSDRPNNTGWVYIYDHNSTTQMWSLTQSIESPLGQNSYFGVSVKIDGDELIVGASGYPLGKAVGASVIYRRDYIEPEYKLTAPPRQWYVDRAMQSVSGERGQFGLATDITRGYAVVGAYGHNDLQGKVSFVCHNLTHAPTAAPVTALPTEQPTSHPTDGKEAFSAGGAVTQKVGVLSMGFFIAVVLIGCLVLCVIGVVYYCVFHSPRQPAGGDKNKARDELSDEGARVYSYRGYGGSEAASSYYNDDEAAKNAARDGNASVYSSYYSTSYGETFYGNGDGDESQATPTEYSKEFRSSFDEVNTAAEDESILLSMSIDTENEKKNKLAQYGPPLSRGGESDESITDATMRRVMVDSQLSEEQLRVKYPYKVYSYKGYHENGANGNGRQDDDEFTVNTGGTGNSNASTVSTYRDLATINRIRDEDERIKNKEAQMASQSAPPSNNEHLKAQAQQSVDLATQRILSFQQQRQAEPQQQPQPQRPLSGGFSRPRTIALPTSNHAHAAPPMGPVSLPPHPRDMANHGHGVNAFADDLHARQSISQSFDLSDRSGEGDHHQQQQHQLHTQLAASMDVADFCQNNASAGHIGTRAADTLVKGGGPSRDRNYKPSPSTVSHTLSSESCESEYTTRDLSTGGSRAPRHAYFSTSNPMIGQVGEQQQQPHQRGAFSGIIDATGLARETPSVGYHQPVQMYAQQQQPAISQQRAGATRAGGDLGVVPESAHGSVPSTPLSGATSSAAANSITVEESVEARALRSFNAYKAQQQAMRQQQQK